MVSLTLTHSVLEIETKTHAGPVASKCKVSKWRGRSRGSSYSDNSSSAFESGWRFEQTGREGREGRGPIGFVSVVCAWGWWCCRLRKLSCYFKRIGSSSSTTEAVIKAVHGVWCHSQRLGHNRTRNKSATTKEQLKRREEQNVYATHFRKVCSRFYA